VIVQSTRIISVIVAATLLAACGAMNPTPKPQAGSSAPGSAWQQVLDAAKAEGALVVYHNLFPGAESTRVAEEFKSKTGLTVDFIGGLGAPLSQRIRTEVAGNAPSADVFEGSSQFLLPMQKDGFLASLKDKVPALQESADTWRAHPGYMSETHELVVSRAQTQYPAHLTVNTSKLAPSDYPTSYNDLATNPKFKGRIGYVDPKTTGDTAAVFIRQGYVGQSYSIDNVWQLYANQQMMLFPGPGDHGAATGRGEVDIAIGASYGNLLQLAGANAPIKLLAFADTPIVSNPTTMGMLKSSKHPNAALVFINWFYSKEGQDYVNNLLQLPGTLRRDVTQYTHPALTPEVVGGGKRGPVVALTLPQSLLAVELNTSGLFQKLTEGIGQAEFTGAVNEYIKKWEDAQGGPKREGVTLKD
jgi:ABC-type Fe3+ transport system substrate-binding protein